jgi:RNA polymerase sigma-70 factor, ECF subfamily
VPGPSSDEVEFMNRVASGDQVAFRLLVDTYRDRLFRFARTLARSDALAEEALQQTFLAAYQSAANFRADSCVKTWLFTIARNAIFKAKHKAGLVVEAAVEADLGGLVERGMHAGWGAESPEDLVSERESREQLTLALDKLPAEHREILVLRDLEQLAGDEVANLLGISLSAMKSRLHRARLDLACELRKGARP